VPLGTALSHLTKGGDFFDSPVFKLEKVVHSKAEELQDFEGPLDLILFLLSKNKMEIQDISISLI